jgi:phytoene desaturase (3,4-didehydrolycopene-forming)
MTTSASAPERIQLQIGEKTFHTTKATVAESSVLASLVNLPPPDNGVYFVDADPALFEHILRYLRTGMFPLFYDAEKGHDLCLYFALLNQARFYQIERLHTWLGAEGYLDAVKRRTWANSMTLYGEQQIEHLEELTHLKNETLRILKVKQSIQKCYKCPHGIWKHDGRRNVCVRDGCPGRASQALSRTLDEVEMRVLKIDYVVNAVVIENEQALPVAEEEEASNPPPYHAS